MGPWELDVDRGDFSIIYSSQGYLHKRVFKLDEQLCGGFHDSTDARQATVGHLHLLQRLVLDRRALCCILPTRNEGEDLGGNGHHLWVSMVRHPD